MKNQIKKLTQITVWSAIILFIVRCAISWDSILKEVTAYDLFSYAGEAIGVAAIISALYEKVLWRINPFDKTPKLSNKYTGTLKSSFDNIERDAVLEIRQSLLSLHVTMITNESKSTSIIASVDDIMGEQQLTCCYLNTPKSEFRNRSGIHFGTAMISLNVPDQLSGQYYTDRKTAGDMNFSAKK